MQKPEINQTPEIEQNPEINSNPKKPVKIKKQTEKINTSRSKENMEEDFTIIDAIPELKNFFTENPILLEACKEMKNTENNLDKLSILMQGLENII
ncbi:hypothetical protein NPIL_315171 [Nephila pilipes]|uniref:Uncharacterized protein n=1 Tax=Nephila pilipes TaxID=299642 RepID=A0A8X6NTI1_NEPPI|nr:hypothetical protein NPIL_315171 [Nephila pilipes]